MTHPPLTADELGQLGTLGARAFRKLQPSEQQRAFHLLARLSQEHLQARADRDQFADRVDTLTTVCKSNKRAHQILAEDHQRLERELAALHEGEEPHEDERLLATPAQWIWRWNRATPADRLAVAQQVRDLCNGADRCAMGLHEERLGQLEQARRTAGGLHAKVARLTSERDSAQGNALALDQAREEAFAHLRTAEARIAAVRALHHAVSDRSGWGANDDATPGSYGRISPACAECGSQDLATRHPCPTIAALDSPTT